jgi:hypothetical protein
MSYLKFGLGKFGIGPYVRGATYNNQPEGALGDWAKQSDLTAESWGTGTDAAVESWSEQTDSTAESWSGQADTTVESWTIYKQV